MSLWRRLFHFEPRLDQQVEEILKSGKAASAGIDGHVGDKANPHEVAPAQIGAETPVGAQAKVDGHAAAATGVHGVGDSEVESKEGAQAKADAVQANLNTHTGDTENPHQVTPAQVCVWPGMLADFAMPTPPDGWLECNGQAVSRTTYATLFAAIGTIWGAGDGSTTFNVPELRSEFRRGWDHGRGVDAGREFASWQADELKTHSHQVDYNPNLAGGDTGRQIRPAGEQTTTVNTRTTGGTETRPRNRAVLPCIKT